MKKILLSALLGVFCMVNMHSQTIFSSLMTIDAAPGNTPYAMTSGNLDGDVYPDIVVGLFDGNKVLYYKNNGDGTFASAVEISTLTQVSGLFIADVDGINGNDILATSFDGNKLVWYANDGSGNFGTENVISSSIGGAGAVYAANIDSNSGLDVVVGAYNDDKFVWFSNDGSGGFGPEQTIASGQAGAGDFDIADFDGDGDLDIVISTSPYTPPTPTGIIDVYYNQLVDSGTTTFIIDPNNVSNVGNDYLFDVNFADVNNDGALDILASDSYGDLVWYNKEGDGTYARIDITNTVPNTAIVEAVDMDNDGDNDLLVTNGSTGGDDVVWFESLGAGPTTFGPQTTVEGVGAQKQVYAMTVNDFDNDGDLDIATATYQSPFGVFWIENLLETLTTNEETFETNSLSIYPNPTKNTLHIKTNLSNTFTASVYNILGKKVLSASVSNKRSLNVSELSSGIYIIKFEGVNKTFKFIKE